jgi:hypothetical protein
MPIIPEHDGNYAGKNEPMNARGSGSFGDALELAPSCRFFRTASASESATLLGLAAGRSQALAVLKETCLLRILTTETPNLS